MARKNSGRAQRSIVQSSPEGIKTEFYLADQKIVNSSCSPHCSRQFHHVPNSPFLLPTRRPTTQSPIPFVPDVENSRNNNCSSRNLLRNGSFLSPTSVVPSNSNPTSPQETPTRTNVSSDSQREQVVPHFSPLKENKSLNRKGRRLDMSPNQDTVPEINLFSGEEIFA